MENRLGTMTLATYDENGEYVPAEWIPNEEEGE